MILGAVSAEAQALELGLSLFCNMCCSGVCMLFLVNSEGLVSGVSSSAFCVRSMTSSF